MWRQLFLLGIIIHVSQSRGVLPEHDPHELADVYMSYESYELPPKSEQLLRQGRPGSIPCATLPPPPKALDDTFTTSLWDLLDKSRKEIEISGTYKDVVLLLGNTGSGKTTVTQLLAGNASSLEVGITQEKSMVIVDPDRKIGMTTISRTLVPELVVDPQSGLALYDCPGFMDNRGPKVDITANFLLKKITDHVSSLKFVFVSIYSSVYGTEDKSGFDQLATSAVRLIKDFDKFDASIGLVVTKAPNYSNFDGHLLSDDETMLTIRSFLEMYKSVQETRLNSIRPGEDRVTIQKKIKFVSSLLKGNKIWFMRTPTQCGPLINSQGMVDTKAKLTQLMLYNLSFVASTSQDFGYALADSSILQVREDMRTINQNISDIGAHLVNRLKKSKHDKMLVLKELQTLRTFVSDEYEAWSGTINKLRANYSLLFHPTRFAATIEDTLQMRGWYEFSYQLEFTRAMNQQAEYLNFFEAISPEDAHIRNMESWIQPFSSWVEDDLAQRRDWYAFLSRLQTYLGTWEFQMRRPKGVYTPGSAVDLNYIEREILKGGAAGLIDDKIRSIFSSSLLYPQDKTILGDILTQALEMPEIKCDGANMLVTGIYVKVSEFASSESGSYLQCIDAKIVQVFASKTLFVDGNISPKDHKIGNELYIVAPTWDVVTGGTSTFNLGGAVGEDPLGQPSTGTVGARGLDGDAGKPGHSGGHFFGVSRLIIHPERLRVTANGGKGGDGQVGGDGGDGEKGRKNNYDEWPSCYTLGTSGVNPYFDSITSGGAVGFEYWCTKYGGAGNVGSDGGDGGRGGVGGKPGTIETLTVDGEYAINTELTEGPSGTDAPGGKGGLGGERGDGTRAMMATSGIACGYQQIGNIDSPPGHRAGSGKNGATGKSKSNPKDPSTQGVHLIKYTLINSYKTFILTKQTPALRDAFIEILENSKPIQDLYGPAPFAQELVGLEEFALMLKNSNGGSSVSRDTAAFLLIPRYQSFLKRVDTFAKERELNSRDKKVLAILYTTALSQLNCIKQVFGATVVVDFHKYLNTVQENFKRFSSLQSKFVTQEERDQYDDTFNKKIEQAMQFIDETVNPAIDQVEKDVQKTTNDLLTLIQHQEKEAKDNVELAKIRVQRMKETMVMRHIFTALKLGASVVSMLGPQGAAIGGVLGSAASVGEQLAVGSNTPKTRPQNLPLPASVGKYANNMEAKMKAWNEGKMKQIEVLLESTKKAIADNKVAMDDVKKNVDALQKEVDEYEKDKKGKDILTYLERKKKIEEHEKNLKDVLETKKVDLEAKQKGTEEQKKFAKEYGDKALKAIGYIKVAITNTAELGYEIYNTYKNDEAKMSELAGDVEKAQADVDKLQKYKAAITETLEPMSESIAQELDDVTKNLGGKSEVALQVQKWQVKQKLTEYKDFLQDFTEGYAEAKKFSQAVDKLSEGITLMIDLYDFIEKYQDQMHFANYLANINSPDALQITIGNEDGVVTYLNKVELALHASILLVQWERTIQTFKQWVFPYSQFYDADFNTDGIPDYLNPESNITNPKDIELLLINILGDKVTKLNARINEYESMTVGAIDDNLKQAQFNSDSVSTLPFYAWNAGERQESESEVIRNLFAGNKVQISVSPDYSYSRRRSAVKFRIAEFQPKVPLRSDADKDKQAKLMQILNEIKVEMTHSGVSRYAFDDKSFEMVGDNVTLSYNFERDSQGERIETNNVYKKVKQGDFILSPYTMWTVQFLPARVGLRPRYNELVDMTGFVDLELVGSGTYVDEGNDGKGFNKEPSRITVNRDQVPLHFHHFEVTSANVLPATFY